MGLTMHKLGELIELRDVRNTELRYGENDVRGVNTMKVLMPTKADISSRDLSKFQIVYHGEFVFNHRTSRNGSRFSIAYNDGSSPVICTEDYVVFRITEKGKRSLSAQWLYMYFSRDEFDRYVITNSWGSSTEFYNWEDICAVEIPLPSLPVQQKYVAVYLAMLENQRSYERGLDDLKLTCDAVVEKYKHDQSRVALGKLIKESDERNGDTGISSVYGVNKEKTFMPSVASGADLSKYKIVRDGQFACNLMHVGRDVAVPVALNKTGEPIIVSPAYLVFSIDESVALPEYVLLWLSRNETDRYAWFMSDTNVRSGMEKARFYDIDIPTPSLPEQSALVELYNVISMRRNINTRLKSQLRDICPVLIKGSLEEGQG